MTQPIQTSPDTALYSRENPSPRYRELIAMYRTLHEQGSADVPPEKMFSGISLPPLASDIKQLITQFGSKTMLDYGCGKGQQYLPMSIQLDATGEQFDSIQSFWGVENIHRYDPAYQPFSTLPEGQFDGVICTDVLEHCPEQDMPWILGELFRYSRQFVFANIASYPAKKTLPNGENAHCTIQPAEWWAKLIGEVSAPYPQVAFLFLVRGFEQGPNGPQPRQISLVSSHFKQSA